MIVRMKLVIYLLIGTGLLACGGAVDNADPPATLVEITDTAKLKLVKEIEYGFSDSQYVRIKPLVLEKEVVFSDAKGSVTVFDKNSFNIRWKKNLDIHFSSAVGGNQQLYVIGTRSGEVIAISPENGDIKWRVKVSSEVLARPVASANLIFVKTVDGRITALSSDSGKQKWIYQREVPALSVRGNAEPVILQDKLITGLDNGKIIILNLETGLIFWEKTITVPHGRSEIERLVDLDADLLVKGSVVYIAGFQGKIAALDLQRGEFIWTKKMSVINNMAFEDNKLFVTDNQSHIWAIDATTGATIWKQDVFSARSLTSPVLLGEFILVADYQGYLHVIAKADGHQVTRLQVDEAGINVNPIVINDKVYLQSKNSVIYVLELTKLSK